MLKYEAIAQVGDRIRAYDFQGRTDCYVEGPVIRIDREGREKGYAAFVITVEVDGWPKRGSERVSPITGRRISPNLGPVMQDGGSRVGATFYIPMQVGFLEHDGRIVNLSAMTETVIPPPYTGTPYEGFGPRRWCLSFISRYGQIKEAHHKAWVLDQCARILHGTPVVLKHAKWKNGEEEYRFCTDEPSQRYLHWAKVMEEEGGYDEGITP